MALTFRSNESFGTKFRENSSSQETHFHRSITSNVSLSVVRRLTSLGKPDKNFGLGGSAYPYGLSESVPVNLAAGPNSLYVLVKTWDLANQYYVPRLTRLTATGGYDTKFSGDGKADFKAFTRRTADIQENYKIRATTTSVILLRYLSTAPSLLQLYRLTATGEIDETFGCCSSVGWAEPAPNFTFEWRDADVVDDRSRIYLRTVTARAGGMSVDARDYVLYSKTIDAVGAVPAAQDPVAGSTTTVVGQTPASGATGANEGSTTDQSAGSTTGSSVLAATTVSPAKDLVVRPLVRGLSVRWSSSANAGASYLVTAVYEDEIKQCQVADGVARVCNFRKLAPWKTYQVSVAAVVDGALSTGIKATAKPVVVMKPATSIKTERLVRPPRSPQLGKRTWSVRGQCRLVSAGKVLVAGSKAGICVVTVVTAKSGKLPRIVRSVNVKVGKS